MSELIPALSRVFDGLENGTIQPTTASQMNNSTGKIISALKAQMEYQRIRGEVPNIKFFEQETTK